MTIIVTGGAGFIGSNFVFHMLNKYPDYRIVCLDCLTYAGNLSTLAPVMDNPNFRFVKESITDREAVYKLFEEEKPDMVVNFAAESHVDRSITDPGIFVQTNDITQKPIEEGFSGINDFRETEHLFLLQCRHQKWFFVDKAGFTVGTPEQFRAFFTERLKK